jgi:hypothetical protein
MFTTRNGEHMLSSNVGFVLLESTSACVGAIDNDLIRFIIDLSQPFQDLAQTLVST